MGEIFMRKWTIAVIIGVLMPIPISLLMQYLAQLQADTGNIWYGYAQSALIFLSYFFLGVFLAALQRLQSTGTERRFRWPEFVLGLILLLLTAMWALEQATGILSAIPFIAASKILTEFVTFTGGLYLWVVMAGYFMTDAFAKDTAQSTAQGGTQNAAQGAMQSTAQSAVQCAGECGVQRAAQSATQGEAQAAALTLAAAETTSLRRSERKKMEQQAGKKGGRPKRVKAKAAASTAPIAPTVPATPTAPATPVAPAVPTAATTPTASVAPTVLATPVAPAVPTAATTPTASIAPTVSEVPTASTAPAEPTTPAESATPIASPTSATPSVPIAPVEPKPAAVKTERSVPMPPRWW